MSAEKHFEAVVGPGRGRRPFEAAEIIRLAGEPQPPGDPAGTQRIEFELNYFEPDPRASAFASDVLTLDRGVRRTAREVRDGVQPRSLKERFQVRPLRIDSGLLVGDSHRSNFGFVLHVPHELYEFILSNPLEFALRVFALDAAAASVRRVYVRRRRRAGDEAIEVPVPGSSETTEEETETEHGASASPPRLERIQRIAFRDGTQIEIVERTW
jgi:hypothetical protein